MALDLIDYKQFAGPVLNATTHSSSCEECKAGYQPHEFAIGVWHIPSRSTSHLFHECRLNVGGVHLPSCSCPHGTLKSSKAPLHCDHYLVASHKHLLAYGEVVPTDPREPEPVVVHVVESNGIELFGNDEPERAKAPRLDRLVVLFDKIAS